MVGIDHPKKTLDENMQSHTKCMLSCLIVPSNLAKAFLSQLVSGPSDLRFESAFVTSTEECRGFKVPKQAIGQRIAPLNDSYFSWRFV
mmetsp:Transcript_19363/g.39681  ORF Transcript_19363/g.39681 Transcript_19363/m.39681 type:complete len:88 (-) Transcript_19363:64-327(-)